MNVLTIVAILIMAACMVFGFSRGFIRVLFSLVSLLLLIVLVSWAAPHISTFIKDNTGLYQSLQQFSTDRIRNVAGSNPETTEDSKETAVSGIGMPFVMQREFMEQEGDALQGGDFIDAAGSYMAGWIIKGAAFLLALLVAKIVLRIIVEVLDLFTKLPVIGGINRLLGLGAGILLGNLLVWLLLFLVVVVSPSDLGQQALVQIHESPILSFFYNYNWIVMVLNFGWPF